MNQAYFVEQMPRLIGTVRKQFDAINVLQWNDAVGVTLLQAIQQLSKAVDRIGIGQLSDTVHELERRLRTLLDPATPPGQAQWAEFSRQLGVVEHSMLETLDLAVLCTQPDTSQLIHLVVDDAAQATHLGQMLTENGYRVTLFNSLEQFRSARQCGDMPAAVVMEFSSPGSDEAFANLVGEFRSKQGKCPPLLLATAQDDLTARLAAHRAGAASYLAKPINGVKLLRMLDEITGRHPSSPYRVLLVDDDNVTLTAQAAILRRAGMEVATLNDPLQLFESLRNFFPDVLIFDLYMPQASGLELAAVLSKDDSYAHLPILFLSSEQAAERQQSALDLGADDFLVKPVDAGKLVNAVTARAHRARRARRNGEMMSNIQRALYEREREHRVLDQHAIVSVADVTGKILYVNDKFCQISGYKREELLGQNHRIVKSDHHPADYYREMWQTIASGKVWHGEMCNRRKDGSLYWVESTIAPFLNSNGKPYQYVSIRTDISRLKENEQALAAIVKGTAAVTGKEFFAGAVEGLASALRMKVGFIAERDPQDNSMLRTLALWSNGQLAENISYPIVGTPCEKVVNGEPSLFTERVAERFPHDTWLRENGFESYIAIPLYDSNGKLLGHMGALDDRVLDSAEGKMDLLRIFAARVAGEIERGYIEAEVEDQKERLRRGQIYANIGTWDWNIRTGELFWTERIAALFGYQVGELETSYENFLGAVHPDDRQSVNDAVTACVQHDVPYEIEHRVVWPDGTVRWLLERGAVVRDGDGAPLHMLGVVMDINERKLAEQLQRESEEKFRTLFEISPVGIALNAMDGTFIEANRALLDAIGYGVDEYRHLTYWQLTPEEYGPQEQHQLEMLQATGRYGPFEKEYIHKDGHRVPVLLSGALIVDRNGEQRIWSIIQDITERKRSERELLIFKRLFESTGQGIGVSDARGNLLYANSAHDRLHGYPVGETVGMHFTRFLSQETLDWAIKPIMSAIQSGHGWSGLLPIVQPNGDEVMTAANVGFIPGENGEPQYLFNLMSDYTPELRRQQQLAEAKEAAERASQAKSDFLSSMSHELRTPMNAILGFAQILEMDGRLDLEQQDSITEIMKAGHHLLSLINEVLDLARIESGRIDLSLEPVVVEELVEECYALVQPLAEKREISLTFGNSCGMLARADRVRFKQVLLNLLSNAIKYNRTGGEVEVTVCCDGMSRLRLRVRDSGYGIAAERIGELFKPFSRLDAEQHGVEGTGIGLTISQRLVELMGGEIGVESIEGSGTTFWIELPAEPISSSDVGAPASDMRDVIESTSANGIHQVLYIEDNPVNLKLVSQLLGRRPNIALMTAHTPELGIELALAHRPQLILLDINMPGMDGYQVLEVFKSDETLCDIPVIAITANALPRDIERGMAAGFSDYLTKPLNARMFIETVERWLSSHGVQISSR